MEKTKKIENELLKSREVNFTKFLQYSRNVVIISILVLIFLAIFNS